MLIRVSKVSYSIQSQRFFIKHFELIYHLPKIIINQTTGNTNCKFLTLYSSLQPEHWSSPSFLQQTLFLAVLFSCSHIMPILWCSSITVLFQGFFGRPLFVFPCGFYSRDCRVMLVVGFLKSVSNPSPFLFWDGNFNPLLLCALPQIFVGDFLWLEYFKDIAEIVGILIKLLLRKNNDWKPVLKKYSVWNTVLYINSISIVFFTTSVRQLQKHHHNYRFDLINGLYRW